MGLPPLLFDVLQTFPVGAPGGNLRLFIHILTDNERIIDPDGQECADLATAQAEACQSARELMAQELRAGRPPPRVARSDSRRRGCDIRHHQL